MHMAYYQASVKCQKLPCRHPCVPMKTPRFMGEGDGCIQPTGFLRSTTPNPGTEGHLLDLGPTRRHKEEQKDSCLGLVAAPWQRQSSTNGYCCLPGSCSQGLRARSAQSPLWASVASSEKWARRQGFPDQCSVRQPGTRASHAGTTGPSWPSDATGHPHL